MEEDIVLKKDKLFQTTPRQAVIRPGNSLTNRLMSPVKYHISTSITYHSPIQEAFQEYGGIMAQYGHDWVRVFNESEADIVVRGYEEISGVCGYAEWPTFVSAIPVATGIVIGENIYINKYQWQNMSTSQRKLLIAHEIGHTLGIRHTNWRQLGESEFFSSPDGGTYGAYTVLGTDNTSLNPDPQSIFNGESCGRTWGTGITSGDFSAIATMIGYAQ